MQNDLPGAVPEISYAVEYQTFAGNLYNLDLTGKGHLVIRPAGPVCLFSGAKRESFSFRHDTTLELHADEIRNVAVDGRCIRFHTERGESGRRKKPFVFFCRNAVEAAAIAARLPTRQDADFVAVQNFQAVLATLPTAANPWTMATNLLVAANVAVFIVMGLLGAGWLRVENMMPYILYGANNGAATTDGEWWRLVTCMFMHYGLVHLGMNMWALYQTGHLVEKLFGRGLYLLVYFGSGIIASFASILWHGDKTWSAGASGAVFGVYGALLGYMLREKHGLPRSVFQPMLRSTLGFAAYNILYGLVHPGIDNAAHVGGLVGGIALGWLVALPLDQTERARLFPTRLRLGLVVTTAVVITGIALSPRYDYRVQDELAWSIANQDHATREPPLLKQLQNSLRELKGPNGEVYAQWLETKLVPFYQEWSRQIARLELAPNRATALRRDTLLRIFERRIASYQHLIASLRAHEADALKRYLLEDRQVLEAIANLHKSDRQAAGGLRPHAP